MPLFLKLHSRVRLLILFWKNLNNIALARQMKRMNVAVSISVIKKFDLIRDRVVMGIRDNTTRKKLLQVPKLSLSQCIDVCRSYGKTSQQLESMKSNQVKAFNKVLPQSTPTSKQKTGEQNLIRCKFCATTHTRDKFQCPAWGKTCSVCKRRNHFAAACSNKPPKTPHRSNRRMVSSIDHDTDSSEEYIATLTMKQSVSEVYLEENDPKPHKEDQWEA